MTRSPILCLEALPGSWAGPSDSFGGVRANLLRRSNNEQIETAGINIHGGETFEFEFEAFTGVLQPGSYQFSFGADLQIQGAQINTPIPGSFANGAGQFEFRLDRLQGNNHVPDAGSTLAMLGMALSALGGMARLRAVCF
jgi:hypothetical protein